MKHYRRPFSRKFLTRALLRKQWFPAVRKNKHQELPPLFSSNSFSNSVATELVNSVGKNKSTSAMHFTTSKFNGSVRIMTLPHPTPYSSLVLHLSEHWHDIAPKLSSRHSKIRPSKWKDGRIIVMSYGRAWTKAIARSRNSVGNRYLVRADISNCFPSIYTHSVDWALRNRRTAKANRSDRSWESETDKRFQNIADNETKGVGIGPAVSNIAAELVLQRVDREMTKSFPKIPWARNIDDYEAFVENEDAAFHWIASLSEHLSQYRLHLNTAKLEIVKLGDEWNDAWMAQINRQKPNKKASPGQVFQYLMWLEQLAKQFPSESVLRYGLRSVEREFSKYSTNSKRIVISTVLELSTRHTFLAAEAVGFIKQYLERLSLEEIRVAKKALLVILDQGLMKRESDTVLWSLYGLHQIGSTPKPNLLKQCIRQDPMVATGVLSLFPDQIDYIAKTYSRKRYIQDPSTGQAVWLVRYQLYLAKRLKEPKLEHDIELRTFRILKKHSVDFLVPLS